MKVGGREGEICQPGSGSCGRLSRVLALQGVKAKGREGARKTKMGITYKWVCPSPFTWLPAET